MAEGCLEALLTDIEVAKALRVSVALTRRWRRLGEGGPQWLRIGKGCIRYRPADVQTYIAERVAAAQRAA